MSADTPEAVPRFPLSWPTGWRRTPAGSRRAGTFNQTESTVTATGVLKRVRGVSMATAVDRLERQLALLGGQDATLSTNIRLNLRGIPYGAENPADPGAAVYFRFKGKATVLACDRFLRVADNVAAIAAHIDALRRVDRYGVGTLEQALAGYKALPADTAANWRQVFGFGDAQAVSAEMVQQAFRGLAASAHPDKGGTDEGMMHLNRAREYALAELLA